ncbi:MAG TPA: type II secretion system protein GspM [Burkholderiales bacterium]|nr:type II secretion system protein GspM [Burkholderiales bacterium]
MKYDWKTLAGKIDDMNLRERALIFGMLALILVALVFTVFLDPLFARQKILSQQIVQKQNQIKSIQAQIQAIVEPGSDPDAANRAKQEALKQQLAQSEAYLQGKQQHLIPPDKIAALLEEILNRNRRLQLVSLQTLQASTLSGKEGRDEKEMFKHGVEITVRGGYLDLLEYVTELEMLPSQMFWAKVSLSVETYPSSRLSLTLYTLSLDRIWMRV